MRAFRDISIKGKLTLIIVLTSSLTLGLACGAFVIYDLITFRHTMVNALSSQAEIIGNSSTAALAFGDEVSAEQTLEALRAVPHIVSAYIFATDGNVIAKYLRNDINVDFSPPVLREESHTFRDNHLALFRRIVLDGEVLGTIYIQSDLLELYSRLRQYGFIVVFIILASSLVALFISSKLQRVISQPILHLANTAKIVSVKKDYSVRAVKVNQDELGLLTDCFNRMLIQIQERDSALLESETRLRSITQSANEAIISADSSGRIISWNMGAQKIFGHSEEEILGKPLTILLPERYREAHRKGVERMGSGGETHVIGKTVELQGLRKDGKELPLELSLATWQAGGETFYTGIIRDITERKQAEEELRKAHEENEQLLKSISSILIAVSKDDLITHWNSAACIAFGKSSPEVIGKSFNESGISWDWTEISKLISNCRKENRTTRLADIRYVQPDGKEGFLNLAVSPSIGENVERVGFLLIGEEITEHKILESQLTQAQKLESLGQLAAGIAHEINTPIQYVGDNTRFLQDAFNDLGKLLSKYVQLVEVNKTGGVADELIKEVESVAEEVDLDYLLEESPAAIAQTLNGVEQVASIVRAMKEFSHPGTEEKTLTDINKALENTITVARNEWKYVADLVTDLDPSLPLVPCLPGELNQVFLNIIVNAAQAISDVVREGSSEKGTITVSTSHKSDWVEIHICDTGTGIPDGARSKIFDPFFTTKEVGKGTGQGLAISHSVVVEKHGGSITFETEMGRGTTFIIRLPLSLDDSSVKVN